MRLTALDVRDLRIIRQAAIEPGQVNLVFGPNAAGKTSLLEAIHLLGSGRSFAATRSDRLIRTGAGPLRVVGRVQHESGGHVHRVGIERSPGSGWRMRLDGAGVDRLATLARVVPVLCVHPGSHELLAGGPDERRRLLDWGLFHVEPGFHRTWQRYRRALGQRNTLLRQGRPARELRAWDGELVAAGEALDWHRRGYVDALTGGMAVLAPRMLRGGEAVTLGYRPGWDPGRPLAEVLRERLDRDREARTTTTGPHRAELTVGVDGRDSRQRVSRGQQKLLVYLVRLAQADHLARVSGSGCVLLLDDLAAELDADHRRRVVAVALEVGAQIFITALEAGSVEEASGEGWRWFHVEQGEVREVVQ